MNRLIEKMVFLGFVTCWRFAGAPTSRWPSRPKATTDGVVRPPSAFGMTVGSEPSSTAMQELVVPRSIPMVFAMGGSPSVCESRLHENMSLTVAGQLFERTGRRCDEQANDGT